MELGINIQPPNNDYEDVYEGLYDEETFDVDNDETNNNNNIVSAAPIDTKPNVTKPSIVPGSFDSLGRQIYQDSKGEQFTKNILMGDNDSDDEANWRCATNQSQLLIFHPPQPQQRHQRQHSKNVQSIYSPL